jgi:hypothetical protein
VDSSPKAREGYRRLIPMMPKCKGYRCRGERCREGGTPIPRKGGCQCRVRAMPMPSGTDADAEGYQVRIPITQQLSVLLAVRCERRVWKLFQDKSTVCRTSNLL